MSNYAKHASRKATPQTEPATAAQVQNKAGGFVFAVSRWEMLDRFLILGTEGGSYYATEHAMTRENAKNVETCLAEDGPRAVRRIVEISKSGRALKNDPAIFALALAASTTSLQTNKLALVALPEVCRIGTHLFAFCAALGEFRGYGRSVTTTVSNWYLSKPVEALAYDVLKYQSRNGWSHRDVLRLAHPRATHDARASIFEWIRNGTVGLAEGADTPRVWRAVKRGKGPNAPTRSYRLIEKTSLPTLLAAYDEMKATESPKEAARLIRENGFTREMVPTQHLNDPGVWEALLCGSYGLDSGPPGASDVTMPTTALIRNLGKMSAVGLLKPLSGFGRAVADALVDPVRLKSARIHPLQIFSTLHTYGQGHGEKGSLTWTPDPRIVEALNTAFYLAFAAIEPTGKNWLLALDVSASMGCGEINGMPGLTPRVASGIMAMVTARVEKNYHVVAFGNRLHPLDITPSDRLDTVCSKISNLPFGMTDCALPMLYAAGEGLDVDAFAIYTDSETFLGSIHPFQALKAYRAKSGRNSKFIVQAFTATEYSIADASDPGSLNVVGLDAATPALMSEFVRGSFDAIPLTGANSSSK